MGSDPGFNFLADNFMGATYLWTDAETGQYIRGLCLQKLNGHLSFDDLNTVVKGNQKILAKFIKDEKGLYFNERLQKEIDKRAHHSQLQRDRINKRWNKSDTTVLPGNQSGNTCNETDIETDIVIDLEVKEGMQGEELPEPKKPLTWRTTPNLYLESEQAGYEAVIADKVWLEQQEKIKPFQNLNILKTIERAHLNFWSTLAGWKHKKKSKTVELDWQATFANAIGMKSNQVFDDRNKQQQNQQSPEDRRKELTRIIMATGIK